MPIYLPRNIAAIMMRSIISGKIIKMDGSAFQDSNP